MKIDKMEKFWCYRECEYAHQQADELLAKAISFAEVGDLVYAGELLV
jgi:hypothetical protein